MPPKAPKATKAKSTKPSSPTKEAPKSHKKAAIPKTPAVVPDDTDVDSDKSIPPIVVPPPRPRQSSRTSRKRDQGSPLVSPAKALGNLHLESPTKKAKTTKVSDPNFKVSPKIPPPIFPKPGDPITPTPIPVTPVMPAMPICGRIKMEQGTPSPAKGWATPSKSAKTPSKPTPKARSKPTTADATPTQVARPRPRPLPKKITRAPLPISVSSEEEEDDKEDNEDNKDDNNNLDGFIAYVISPTIQSNFANGFSLEDDDDEGEYNDKVAEEKAGSEDEAFEEGSEYSGIEEVANNEENEGDEVEVQAAEVVEVQAAEVEVQADGQSNEELEIVADASATQS